MRKAALTSLVFVACGFATSAQLSITPKVGIEQSFTSVQYNNMGCISPMGSTVSPQVALRADYLFKKMHGPFVAIATNRSLIGYEFTNPETGNKEFTASRGDWQLRYEAGYQVSSKSIQVGKAKMPAKPSTEGLSPCAAGRVMHNYYRAVEEAARKPMMNVRIQPYAGMAFIPNPQTTLSSALKSTGTVYQYNAGNWNSAFISGVNFAFSKADRKFVVGVQYLKGIGHMNTETLVTATDNKQVITHLASAASAWNFTIGMPLTLSKPQAAKPVKTVVTQPTVIAPAAASTTAPAQTPVRRPFCCYRSRCSQWQQ